MRYMLVSTVARDAPEDLAESALGRMHPLHVVLQEALYFQDASTPPAAWRRWRPPRAGRSRRPSRRCTG